MEEWLKKLLADIDKGADDKVLLRNYKQLNNDVPTLDKMREVGSWVRTGELDLEGAVTKVMGEEYKNKYLPKPVKPLAAAAKTNGQLPKPPAATTEKPADDFAGVEKALIGYKDAAEKADNAYGWASLNKDENGKPIDPEKQAWVKETRQTKRYADDTKNAVLEASKDKIKAPIQKIVENPEELKKFYTDSGVFNTEAAIDHFDKYVKEHGGGQYTRDMMVLTFKGAAEWEKDKPQRNKFLDQEYAALGIDVKKYGQQLYDKSIAPKINSLERMKTDAKAQADQKFAAMKPIAQELGASYEHDVKELQDLHQSGQLSETAANAKLAELNKQYTDGIKQLDSQYKNEMKAVNKKIADRYGRITQEVEKIGKSITDDQVWASIPADDKLKIKLAQEAAQKRLQTKKSADKRAVEQAMGAVGGGIEGLLGKWTASGWFQGLADFGDFLSFKGFDTKFSRYLQSKRTEAEELSPAEYSWNENPFMRALSSTATSLGASAPITGAAIGVSALTGGLGLPAVVGTIAGGATAYLAESSQIQGGIYQQSLAQTLDPSKAAIAAREAGEKLRITAPLYFLSMAGLENTLKGGFKKTAVGFVQELGEELPTEYYQSFVEAQKVQGYSGTFAQFVKENPTLALDVMAGTIGQSGTMGGAVKVYQTLFQKTPSAQVQLYTDMIQKGGVGMAVKTLQQQLDNDIITTDEYKKQYRGIQEVVSNLGRVKELGLEGDDAKAFLSSSSRVKQIQQQIDVEKDEGVKELLNIRLKEAKTELTEVASGKGVYAIVTLPGGANQTVVMPVGSVDEEVIKYADKVTAKNDPLLTEDYRKQKETLGNAENAPAGMYEDKVTAVPAAEPQDEKGAVIPFELKTYNEGQYLNTYKDAIKKLTSQGVEESEAHKQAANVVAADLRRELPDILKQQGIKAKVSSVYASEGGYTNTESGQYDVSPNIVVELEPGASDNEIQSLMGGLNMGSDQQSGNAFREPSQQEIDNDPEVYGMATFQKPAAMSKEKFSELMKELNAIPDASNGNQSFLTGHTDFGKFIGIAGHFYEQFSDGDFMEAVTKNTPRIKEILTTFGVDPNTFGLDQKKVLTYEREEAKSKESAKGEGDHGRGEQGQKPGISTTGKGVLQQAGDRIKSTVEGIGKETEVNPAAKKEVAPTATYSSKDTSKLEEAAQKVSGVKRKIYNDAARILGAMKKIAPDLSFTIHDSEESYNKAVEKYGGSESDFGTEGFFVDAANKQIHINIDNIRSELVLHEAAHPLLDMITKENPEVIKAMYDEIVSLAADMPGIENVIEFGQRYQSDGDAKVHEETVVEFLAQVADGTIDIGKASPSVLKRVKNLIEKIASTIGLNFKFDTSLGNAESIVDVARQFTEAIQKGSQLEYNAQPIKSGDNVIAVNVSMPKKFSKGVKIKTTRADVKRADAKSLSGKDVTIIPSDRLHAAEAVNEESGKVHTAFGGIFYNKVTGRVWASANKTGANNIKKNLRFDENGFAYIGIMTMGNESHMSNVNTFRYVLDSVEAAVKKNQVSNAAVIEKVNRALKTAAVSNQLGEKFEVKGSLKKVIDTLHENFEVNSANFNARREFLEAFLGKTIVAGKKSMWGGVPTFNEVADRLTEPAIKDVPHGHVVAYMKVSKDIEVKETSLEDKQFHISYPVALEASDTDFFLLNQSIPLPEIAPEMQTISGNVLKWSEYEKTYGEEKGKQKYARQVLLHPKTVVVPKFSKSTRAMTQKEYDGYVNEQRAILEPLMPQFKVAREEIIALTHQLMKDIDGFSSDNRIKNLQRAAEKIVNDYLPYGKDHTEMKDIARNDMIVIDANDIKGLMQAVRDHYKDSELVKDNTDVTTKLGFKSSYIVAKALVNGANAEFQFAQLPMYMAKEGMKYIKPAYQKQAQEYLKKVQNALGENIPDGLGHFLYEIHRDRRASDEVKTRLEALSTIYYAPFSLAADASASAIQSAFSASAASNASSVSGSVSEAPTSRDIRLESLLKTLVSGLNESDLSLFNEYLMKVPESAKQYVKSAIKGEDTKTKAKSKPATLRELGVTKDDTATDFIDKLIAHGGAFTDMLKLIKVDANFKKIKFEPYADLENVVGGATAGLYHPEGGENAGLLQMSNNGDAYRTGVHELMHFLTLDSAIANEVKGSNAYKALNEMYEYIASKKGKPGAFATTAFNYGLVNVKEFMAELLINEDFRNEVSDVVAKNWDEIVKNNKAIRASKATSIGELIADLFREIFNALAGKKESGIAIDASKPVVENAVDLAGKLFFPKKGDGKLKFSKGRDQVLQDKLTAIKWVVRSEIKGTKDLKAGVKEKIREEVEAMLKDAQERKVLTGEIKAKYLVSVTNKLKDVNSPYSMLKFTDYLDKVLNNIEYDQDLKHSNATKKKIRKAIKDKKSDRSALTKDVIKEFLRINPDSTTDIKEYAATAEKILSVAEGIRVAGKPEGVRVKNEVIAISHDEITDYTDKQKAYAMEQAAQRIADMHDDLVAAGIIDPKTMSVEEMQKIIEAINGDSEAQIDKVAEKMAAHENKMKALKAITEYARIGLNEYNNSSPDLTTEEQQIVNDLLKIDLSKLTGVQLAKMIDVMNEIVVNENFVGSGEISIISKVQQNVKQLRGYLKAKGINLTDIKNQIIKNAASINLFFEFIARHSGAAAEIQRLSGISGIFDSHAKAKNLQAEAVDGYKTMKKKMSGDIDSAANKYRRGVYADVMNSFGGTRDEQIAEFQRRKRWVEATVKRLKDSAEKKEQLEGRLLEGVYNELLEGAENPEDVTANMKMIQSDNIPLVGYWQKQFQQRKELVKENAELYNNQTFEDVENYTATSIKGVDNKLGATAKRERDLFEQTFISQGLRNDPAGTKIAKSRSPLPPKNSVLNLDFDSVQSRKYYETNYDVETSKAIAQTKQFLESEDAIELLGGTANRKTVTEAIQKSVALQRGQSFTTDKLAKTVIKALNPLQGKAVRIALASIAQWPKQYVSIAFNTMINLWKDFDLFGKAMFVSKDIQLFDQFNIGLRGETRAGYNKEVDTGEIEQALIGNNTEKAWAAVNKKTAELSEFLMSGLVKADIAVARRSWLAFYMQSMRQQGEDVRKIDWESEHLNPNMQAAAYAEQMVSRSQNPNDASSMANLYKQDKNGWFTLIKNVILPFSSFSVNMRMRMTNDVQKLFTASTAEGKKEAAKSLLATATEQVIFNGIKVYMIGQLTTMGAAALAKFMGFEEDDDDEEKDKAEAEKKKRKWLANTTSDMFFSGMGSGVQGGLQEGMNALHRIMSTKVDEFGDEVKVPDLFYSPDKNWMDYLGMYAIAPKKVIDVWRDGKLLIFGTEEVTKGGFNPETETVDLTPEEQRTMVLISILDGLALVGLSDAEVTQVNNKLRTIVNKKMAERVGEIRKVEMGFKPK